jgi:Uma2 family endonuclease
MSITSPFDPGVTHLPDHTELPESDGTFVKNFQEHPQSILLTDSIRPVLQQLHPNGRYCIGQDCGIYWRLTDPPEKGAEAPDWFYVPNVPPLLDGEVRRSYVLWKELLAPLIVLEFVSGDGSEERERTSALADDEQNGEEKKKPGKFWVYEQAIRVPFYGIYEVKKASVEMYHLVDSRYELMSANERGHYPITPIGVELGIWQGQYEEMELPWLRWWDSKGNLLLTGDERSQLLASQLEQERQRAERLAERLRQMGINPDEV